MYIVKYSELVHMAEMNLQARASSPYELVPSILRYTFNNLILMICFKSWSNTVAYSFLRGLNRRE